MSEEYKISVPLFEKGELETFDNNIHSIVEEYSKMLFKEKDQILTQRIIMKQEEEIERLNNIINELEKELKNRIKNVPDTMAEVYEDESILYKLQELKGVDKE